MKQYAIRYLWLTSTGPLCLGYCRVQARTFSQAIELLRGMHRECEQVTDLLHVTRQVVTPAEGVS